MSAGCVACIVHSVHLKDASKRTRKQASNQARLQVGNQADRSNAGTTCYMGGLNFVKNGLRI